MRQEEIEVLFALMRLQFFAVLTKLDSVADYMQEPNRVLAAQLLTGEVAVIREQLQNVATVLDHILAER